MSDVPADRVTADRTSRLGPIVAPPDHATAIKPFISISPFSSTALDAHDAFAVGTEEDVADVLRAHARRDYTLTTGGRQALDLILTDIGLTRDDVVTIVTTSGGAYVSGCVTRTIERHCSWSMRLKPRTRAVIAIHEWGRPCERARQLVGGDVPLIEDCAYAFASHYHDGTPVGTLGDYAVYSLGKMFSVNFGGLATGLRREVPATMSAAQRRYVLARVGPELARLPQLVESRSAVWNALAKRFIALGAPPYFDLALGVVPSVFMFAVDAERVQPEDVKRRYQMHGVESSVFYGSDAVYIPCHHHLGAGTVAFLSELYRDLLAERDAERASTMPALGEDAAC